MGLLAAGEGKFFFTMRAAFAELERDIVHKRTMAGLAAAKAQGRTGGRPTVMDADKLAAARARRDPRREPRHDRQVPSASAAPRSTGTSPLRASKARRRVVSPRTTQ